MTLKQISSYLSRNEIIWENYYIDDKIKYIVTTKNKILRDLYYLYKVKEDGIEEVKKSNNPSTFHNLIK